jgi:hypothetical protein
MDINRNIKRQKNQVIIVIFFSSNLAFLIVVIIQVVDAAQKASSVLNLLSNVISNHLPVGDSFDVNTSSLMLSLRKTKASDLNSSLQIDGDKIELPSFCDMQNKPSTSNFKTNELGPLLDLNEEENKCDSRVITTQVGD